jgi:hypothetical protein
MTMSDDITINELRKQLARAEAELVQYREARELWDALELKANQHVVHAQLLAKVKDFETGHVSVSMSNSDGMDWMDQVALIHTASIINQQTYIEQGDGRDDD